MAIIEIVKDVILECFHAVNFSSLLISFMLRSLSLWSSREREREMERILSILSFLRWRSWAFNKNEQLVNAESQFGVKFWYVHTWSRNRCVSKREKIFFITSFLLSFTNSFVLVYIYSVYAYIECVIKNRLVSII